MQPDDVRLGPTDADPAVDAVVHHVVRREGARAGDEVPGWLECAQQLGDALPAPATGATSVLWGALATLGATDLQLARAVEPHLDALAILGEARAAGHTAPVPAGSTWGVFAAEGPEARLAATPTAGGWRLSGLKPWCSLAHRLSHALVTAWVDEEQRGLFLVDLDDPGVRTSDHAGDWRARGLRDVVSLPVTMSEVPARPVGPPGWYLDRDGFSWGAIGVAAVWYGGAVGLARRLAAPPSRPRDQLAHVYLGEVDQRITAARAVLREAADEVDRGRATGRAGTALALRVRAVVVATCEAVLTNVEHALGPGPQVQEPAHAARLVDLRLYLRQHHAERDLAILGRIAEERGGAW